MGERQREAEAEPEPEKETEAEPEPQREQVLCVPIGDCGAYAWCDQDKLVAWCSEQAQISSCPAPFCKRLPNLAQLSASFVQQTAKMSASKPSHQCVSNHPTIDYSLS